MLSPVLLHRKYISNSLGSWSTPAALLFFVRQTSTTIFWRLVAGNFSFCVLVELSFVPSAVQLFHRFAISFFLLPLLLLEDWVLPVPRLSITCLICPRYAKKRERDLPSCGVATFSPMLHSSRLTTVHIRRHTSRFCDLESITSNTFCYINVYNTRFIPILMLGHEYEN